MVKAPFKSIYQGKTVFVTGHTGFKGSWLSLWLYSLGARVIGFSKDIPTEPSLFVALGLKEMITNISGDVNNINKLKDSFDRYKPEFVFHLAAQSLVIKSYDYPIETLQTNIIGTANLLETCRYCNSVRSVIIVTSDKCYENVKTEKGYAESDPMGGFDPYSSSKGCAELVVNAYRRSFFNPEKHGNEHNVCISSVRAGNVIGGGDWAENRLIPDCIRSLEKKEGITIRNPHSVRPWQFVLEPLSGYLWLAAVQYSKGPGFSGPWNFGSKTKPCLTVEEIVKETIHLWGSGSYLINPSEIHEAEMLNLNIEKASQILKWDPVFDIRTTLEFAVKWYRHFHSGNADNMLSFSTGQILEYTRMAVSSGQKWTKEKNEL